MSELLTVIRRIALGETLTAEQAREAFGMLIDGEASLPQLGGLLMALCVRGETVEEITGAARAMRDRITPIEAPATALDTCGTGGDNANTFNISTACAFVVAGCGVPVAKHGNRAVSSRCGAADVLEALGVNLDMPPSLAAAALREANIVFLFAPRHHDVLRHVGQARRELGTRTIFNLLGPLCNPAQVRTQVVGVYALRWLTPIAEVLRGLGAERAWVVHGADGLDELTTTTHSEVAELCADGRIARFRVTPEEAGLPRAALSDLAGGDARDNAAALLQVLRGARGPYRDIVVLNAAAALVVAGRASSLRAGAEIASSSIECGAASASLQGLVRFTNQVYA